MSRIKAFCGIRPSKEWADRLITVPPDFPLDEAVVTHLKKNPCSFLHLVAPVPDNEFMQGSRDALVYRKAGENLQTFLENGYLLCDQDPCLYLYSVETLVSRQIGSWAVTLFVALLNNTIRTKKKTKV